MPTRRHAAPAPALLAVLFLLLAPAGAAEPQENVDLNSAAVEEIAGLPGVSQELAEAIVARRETEGPFDNLEQVREMEGMSSRVWAGIKERVRALPPLGAEGGTSDRESETERPNIVAIANYFVEFEGIDLEKLPPTIRWEFLEKVNRDECPCGCVGDTIARCTVNDPACPTAPALLRATYEDHLRRAKAAESPSKP